MSGCHQTRRKAARDTAQGQAPRCRNPGGTEAVWPGRFLRRWRTAEKVPSWRPQGRSPEQTPPLNTGTTEKTWFAVSLPSLYFVLDSFPLSMGDRARAHCGLGQHPARSALPRLLIPKAPPVLSPEQTGLSRRSGLWRLEQAVFAGCVDLE